MLDLTTHAGYNFASACRLISFSQAAVLIYVARVSEAQINAISCEVRENAALVVEGGRPVLSKHKARTVR